MGVMPVCLALLMARADSIGLAWDPMRSANVAGYRVYQGGASRIYTNWIDAGKAIEIRVDGLDRTNGIYFWAVTAYDTNGLESDFSAEASWSPGDLLTFTNWPGPLSLAIKAPMPPSMVIGVNKTNQIEVSTDLVHWSVIGLMPEMVAIPKASLPSGRFFFRTVTTTNRERVTITPTR